MSTIAVSTLRHDTGGRWWPAGLWVYPYLAAACTVVMGGLGLMGWYFNVPALKEIGSEGIDIKTNAAAGLSLLGISLLLVLPREPGTVRKRIGHVGAATVCIVGSLTLIEIITGIDVGIDELLLRETSDSLAMNRMGPPAAIALALGGAAVLLLGLRRGSFRPADVLGAMVFIAGVFPFVGYLYGASVLYGMPGWTNTALQGAIGITMAGIAILLARPEQGVLGVVTETGTAGTIVRRLILPIVLFPLLVGWVQVRVLHANAIEYRFLAVLGSLLIVAVLVSLLIGFGRRLSIAEQAREMAADDVRQTQERFSMALINAQAGALDWDLITNKITWSRESYLLYGLGPRNLPANHGDWLALVHPEDRPTIARSLHAAMTSGGEVDMQFRIIGEDAETRWFRTNGRVLRNVDGNPVRFIGITRDITAEKLNEMQLRRTAQRLELLYNTIISVLGTEDAQTAARAVCERVLSHLDCQVMLNYVLSEATPDHIELYSWAGISDEQAKKWSLMHIDAIISGTVVRDGTRIVVEDLPSQTQDPRTNVIRDLGMLAYACHPLLTNGQVIGTIGFGSRTLRRFSLETLALMQAVANHVALAIQRSRASQELTRARVW